MDSYAVALGSALWLGVLTSVSPCPLATNIAAMTYIGNRVKRPSLALLAGLAYTLGRMVTYVALALIVVEGLLAIPRLSMFLRNNMNQILGPILILTGLFLLGVFKVKLAEFGIGEKLAKRVAGWGLLGAGLLGLLFALSFCPVSAALYFGSLIPLAVDHQSSVAMPVAYSIGTALPVVIFAVLIALGTKFVGRLFDKLALFEKWARKVTAVIFILAGLYLTLIYIFKLPL